MPWNGFFMIVINQLSEGRYEMGNTCANCLNAYNGPDDDNKISAFCWNKEWWAQFHPEFDTHIKADETCGTWQQREKNQGRIIF